MPNLRAKRASCRASLGGCLSALTARSSLAPGPQNGRWSLCVVFLIALFGALPSVPAHNIFTSWTDAQVSDARIDLELTLSRISALRLIPDGKTLPPITPENFAEVAPKLKAVAPEMFELSQAGRIIPLTASDVKISGDDDVTFRLTFVRPESGVVRFFGNYVQFLIDGHVGTLVVNNPAGETLGWGPLSMDLAVLDVTLPKVGAPVAVTDKPVPTTAPFATFLKLGVHHILIGYDHLLFLVGLLIACRRFRPMVGIITCFTIAHSLTLGLAAFDVVTLSPRIVEPLIAASIIFVGIENLVMRGAEPKRRWLLTFGFGLIHGFGFAGALKEVGQGLAGRALAMPLFSFNLGVELGQVAVAAVCLPILIALRRREKFELYGPPVVSSIVALAGGYWLLQRTVMA